jgi:enoyl-CoA hydratase/carnithine racemase
MSEPILLYAVEDGLATITLNNPARRNSMSLAMTDAIDEALVAAAKDPAVRAILITGNGPAFSSGGDIERLKGTAAGETPRAERSAIDPNDFFNVAPYTPPEFRSRYTFVMSLGVPVIAAVNGPAVGAGFLLALHCDVRFASTTAAFMTGFARIGATPEVALCWSLTHAIGAGRAREMLLSGRRVEADEALAIGLVTRVLAPEELVSYAADYARNLAARISPRSVRVIKKQVLAAGGQSFAEAFYGSGDDAREGVNSEDFKEGLAAALETRPPRFTGR